ncbi:cysteine--tRNA ligase [Sphingomonas sp. ABOLD]|uniref:Cysteine--tRNA ligase n=1 Tax=Sphingomonas trueperi TaxID=53317 RepID=A0A7X6BBT2_9SPHN|nr:MULTISPECIES: cysteine--tRNA ligase [Sphingomonas]NJB97324.1 cysteinyl-tRNA synthetase [Sphingomonas trueperi]RSV38047.1 cysteine--tRNA ligase [Sphingomonas sp. ABOLE]RSV50573.1 cysteine--tRNA ligase [Sphingomonas sp. ABOLD]
MHDAPLTLYNSLSRSLEPFQPLDPAKGVRVYSCGPTVYNYAHLGNLRAYVFTDTLSRVLRWKGYPLTHIINITDVGHLTSDADAGDDKMEAAARAQAMSIWDIAAHYTAAFKQNIADLNITEPSKWSVATDHIQQMIAFAEKIAPEHCYELDSGLYFDVTTVPDYGRLAGAADDAAESRIDPVDGKRHPQDFAIWRKSPPGEQRQMEWDSPWGKGAPGWHLECSVMSIQYLGAPFDIHTGGIDHREIHHPNEIAQNQAYCGCGDTGAHFWMHNNFLVDRQGKMSKSKGGFTTLQSLIDAGVHPLAYRLLCLQAQYRSELEFSAENLAAALTRLKRLVMTVTALRARAEGEGTAPAAWLEKLDAAVSDDLNTPKALPVLDEMLADKRTSPADRLAALAEFDKVLGLRLAELTREELRVQPKGATITPEAISDLLVERKEARVVKDFQRSDRIRDDLVAAGIEVMDGDPLGWDWKPAL